ncbi:MAG: carbamoyltransferase HypF [Chlamydiia bacterium]|nr:carbamoyltransferase HypF [Chlamydiia bacterium]
MSETALNRIFKIRVTGIVQGVGFRPFIYRLAHAHGVLGWVINDPEGVLIEAQGDASLEQFVAAISEQAPPLANVLNVKIIERIACARALHKIFEIRDTVTIGKKEVVVSPDFHVCSDCLQELQSKGNRRYRYPFINCTNCGPRFSIIQKLPYDRASTTMSVFKMCSECDQEYRDPFDRRYHAQPNACPTCGPNVFLSDREGIRARSDQAIQFTIDLLLSGKIVAIKSVGGFHLTVNAQDGEAVALLRKRKRRDVKPFAVMVNSVEAAGKYTQHTKQEADLLESASRPIVLLKKKQGALPEQIAPRNPNLGLMIASAPLHYLLLNDPRMDILVMTSGNISGYPIVYKNTTAAQLFDVADAILFHNRDIETRADDSVVRVSSYLDLRRSIVSFVRKSKGYAPYVLHMKKPLHKIIAYGAELKTTVALSQDKRIYIGPHIGDLKNDETFQSHQKCIEHLKCLYDIEPEWIACDLHPLFRSVSFALTKGENKVIRVQHHHAHMAACMGENHLQGPTIGVILDGTGYGLDGTIWGGEFLIGDYSSFMRSFHLRHIHLLGGDKAISEPLRIALVLALEASVAGQVPAFKKFTDQERAVFTAMHSKGIHSTPTSSMGRLFDGVAALLDICVKMEYEAQGPIELEALLQRDLSMADPYPFSFENETIDYRPLIQTMVYDFLNGLAIAEISRRFHSTIVQMIVAVCILIRTKTSIAQVVLSGGVFLNEFLLINSMHLLESAGFVPYCHHTIPTNDGGIAPGQILVADALLSSYSR